MGGDVDLPGGEVHVRLTHDNVADDLVMCLSFWFLFAAASHADRGVWSDRVCCAQAAVPGDAEQQGTLTRDTTAAVIDDIILAMHVPIISESDRAPGECCGKAASDRTSVLARRIQQPVLLSHPSSGSRCRHHVC
jgi:hypothetical protein